MKKVMLKRSRQETMQENVWNIIANDKKILQDFEDAKTTYMFQRQLKIFKVTAPKLYKPDTNGNWVPWYRDAMGCEKPRAHLIGQMEQLTTKCDSQIFHLFKKVCVGLGFPPNYDSVVMMEIKEAIYTLLHESIQKDKEILV